MDESNVGKETCVVCGGTEFYVDAGFFYCTECQTQTQQLQEHVHDLPEELTQIKKTRKLETGKKEKEKKKKEDYMTTWESYNYVLIGLVEEMIKLGANPKLKDTTHNIWIALLIKLRVINKNGNDGLPKLSAAPKRRDIELIYGHNPRKRTRRPSESSEYSTVSIKTERRRRKKALVQAEFDQMSSRIEGGAASSSVHETSLQSMKSSTGAGVAKEKKLVFNARARKEIKKGMSKRHLKKHQSDFNQGLRCHKFASSHLNRKYQCSPNHITRQKLYSIIYLALLLNRDPIQLGDLLRFEREGYLSFTRFKSFFPDGLTEEATNLSLMTAGVKKLTSLPMRKLTLQIAKTLSLKIPIPDLKMLSRRYCMELNLPDKITDKVISVIEHSQPEMEIKKHTTVLPNYEARVMGFILYTLKSMFGLDDVTEIKLSEYADKVNDLIDKNVSLQKLSFNFNEWLNYILLRKAIVEKYHFPSFFRQNGSRYTNVDAYVRFREDFKEKFYPEDVDEHEEDNKNKTETVLKHFIEKLAKLQTVKVQKITFKPSLTPFNNYVDNLFENEMFLVDECNSTEYLSKKYYNYSVRFLLQPKEYLQRINKDNKKILIRHGRARKSIVGSSAKSYTLLDKPRKKQILVRLKSHKDDNETKLKLIAEQNHQEKIMLSTKILREKTRLLRQEYVGELIRKFQPLKIEHVCKFCKSKNFNTKTSCCSHLISLDEENAAFSESSCDENEEKIDEEEKYLVHYFPHEGYWTSWYNSCRYYMLQYEKFENALPYQNFKIVLDECSRIIEQPNMLVYEEMNRVELYKHYVMMPGNKNNNITNLIKKAKDNW